MTFIYSVDPPFPWSIWLKIYIYTQILEEKNPFVLHDIPPRSSRTTPTLGIGIIWFLEDPYILVIITCIICSFFKNNAQGRRNQFSGNKYFTYHPKSMFPYRCYIQSWVKMGLEEKMLTDNGRRTTTDINNGSNWSPSTVHVSYISYKNHFRLKYLAFISITTSVLRWQFERLVRVTVGVIRLRKIWHKPDA